MTFYESFSERVEVGREQLLVIWLVDYVSTTRVECSRHSCIGGTQLLQVTSH
jgi:hypothetical protein